MKWLILFLIFFVATSQIFSQGLFDKIKDKVQEKVEDKTGEAIDNATEEKSDEEVSEEVSEDKDKNVDAESEQNEQKPEEKKKDELKTYSKFDFVPGEKIIFYEDFSQDAVGDFPALWNTNGSGEVKTTNLFAGKWFSMTGAEWFIPESVPPLPDNFTIQFEYFTTCSQEDNNGSEFGFMIVEGDYKDPNEGGAIPGKAGIKIWFSNHNVSYSNYDEGSYILQGSKDIELPSDQIIKASFTAQKQRLRLYINETKLFDLPKGLPANHIWNMLRFHYSTCTPFLSNIRVAVGAPDMRNKLITEGKLVTRGILFDVNSDKIKPESYGTLKEIASVLKENADVKVKIVGHTDSDGADAANLDLSKKRAASVKISLSQDFGIDEMRMETDGKGESEPCDKNDNSQGKANNRRVEFIKI